MDANKKHYQVKKEYPEPISMKVQNAAITGQFGLAQLDKSKYFNAAHFDLIRSVVPLRDLFRKTRIDKEAQMQIASEELNHWLSYVQRRKEHCMKDPSTWIEDSSVKLLKESFDRYRNRDSQKVSAPDLIEVHGVFAKAFTFKVPINPRNLSQMLHPHQGYMASMPDKAYDWDEML